MKNYYEILEVNKNASPEIIKVAYKLLVKKYHPDLKGGTEKLIAEEKIKEINEAYDILSNPSKRAEYDALFDCDFVSKEQFDIILSENMHLKNELNFLKNQYTSNYSKNSHSHTYHTNIEYDNKSFSYSHNYANQANSKINKSYLKTYLSEKIRTIIAILLTGLILFIIYKIPFIHNLLLDFINSGYFIFFLALFFSYIYFFYYKNK